MRPCGSDDDCKHPCCSQQKKWVTDMCDDVDTAMLDALITRLKTGDQTLMMCDDSDCYDSYSSGGESSDKGMRTPLWALALLAPTAAMVL